MLSDPFERALITGATSGIGAAFARALSASGCQLVLVGRRSEQLGLLAEELRAKGSKTELLLVDLASPVGIQTVVDRITGGPALDLLVNNAGFGLFGPFTSVPLEAQAEMLRVHVEVPLRLTYAALPTMLERRRGGIINVASISAFVGDGKGVCYAATKAYQVAFSQTLHKGLRGTGVKVQALCPGFTRTEFHSRHAMLPMDLTHIPAFMWLDADRVAAASLNALARDRMLVVPGTIYKLAVFFGRLGLV
jgi:hypothetical protein